MTVRTVSTPTPLLFLCLLPEGCHCETRDEFYKVMSCFLPPRPPHRDHNSLPSPLPQPLSMHFRAQEKNCCLLSAIGRRPKAYSPSPSSEARRKEEAAVMHQGFRKEPLSGALLWSQTTLKRPRNFFSPWLTDCQET
jgi:hypothetical protein